MMKLGVMFSLIFIFIVVFSSLSVGNVDEIRVNEKGDNFVVRDGVEYSVSPSSTGWPLAEIYEYSENICYEGGSYERIDVKVRGKIPIRFEERYKCLTPGGDYYQFDIYLMEADSWTPDDEIALERKSGIKECDSLDDLHISYTHTFENIDIGREFGGGEDFGTIELYVKVISIDEKLDPERVSSREYDVDEISCECLGGACCDTSRRPYDFKMRGAQPNGYSDSYQCSGTNSPTSTSQVVENDYYCDGNSNAARLERSAGETCGTCEFCSVGSSSCSDYPFGTETEKKDCDYLDRACRNYNDVYNYCNGAGGESDASCTDYDNVPKGISCGSGKECDGNGNCITCESRERTVCSSGDEYWQDSCGNLEDKKEECGEDSCSPFWFAECRGDELWETNNCWSRGCSSNSCYENQYKNERFVKTCEFGCSKNRCNEDNSCNLDSDCGQTGYFGNEYCKNGDVYRRYADYDCNNEQCSSDILEKEVESCANGCSGGRCIAGNNGGGECTEDSDCGSVNQGDWFCHPNFKNARFRKYEKPVCSEGGSCSIEEGYVKQTCQYGCEKGECQNLDKEGELLAHWKFDRNARDSAGRHHGNRVGGKYVNTWRGEVLKLNGIDDGVNVFLDKEDFNFGSHQDFSIGFWIKTNDKWGTIVSKTTGWGPPFFRINLIRGRISFVLNDGYRKIMKAGDYIADNKWHYVLISFDREGNAVIHLDKEESARADISSIGDLSNDGSLRIGNLRRGVGQFRGVLDDLRVWNYAK